MNAVLIELRQKFDKVVNVHRSRSLLPKLNPVQNPVDHVLDVEVRRHRLVVQRTMHPEVFVQHQQDRSLRERGPQRLVFPDKSDPRQAVPLSEIDRRRRIPGLQPDHRTLDFWRRPEVVFADFHDVVDPGEELGVDGQPAVEFVAGLSHQTLGKLALEHQDGAAEERAVQEEFEDERRRDLVGDVGHADVEEGQVRLDNVTHHQLQFGLKWRSLDTFLELGHHPRVHLAGHHFLTLSSIRTVKLPVPGPISKTVSVDLKAAFSTKPWTTRGFFRMCWPNPVLKTMPWRPPAASDVELDRWDPPRLADLTFGMASS